MLRGEAEGEEATPLAGGKKFILTKLVAERHLGEILKKKKKAQTSVGGFVETDSTRSEGGKGRINPKTNLSPLINSGVYGIRPGVYK